jgi:hypothetical protein
MLGLLLLALLLASARAALAQTPITAEVDRDVLTIEDQLTLTVLIAGDQMNLTPPDLSGLTDFVVVGHSTTTQISIVNGVMTTQGVFLYRLQPLREGVLVIPPFGVEIGGQYYETSPLEVMVLPGGSAVPAPAPNEPPPDTTLYGQDFFVEAEVDNPTPYVNQQVIYTFRFYRPAQLVAGRPMDYQAPPFVDFWSNTTLSQPEYNTVAAGRHYLVTEIRTALFPAKPGQITIVPARLVIPAILFEPDIILETEPVVVEVQPLPAGAPADFSGAVGQFQIRATLSAVETKVDEPLTLEVIVEGAGNVEILSEPTLPEMEGWRYFESQTSTDVRAKEDVVYGLRSFERLIVPIRAGKYTVPPVAFSYFDPQDGAYHTVKSDPIYVTVLPAEGEPPPLPGAAAPLAGEIHPIKPVPATLEPAAFSLWGNGFYWACWGLPLVTVAGAWAWQSRRQRLAQDVGYARRKNARHLFEQILREKQADVYGLVQRALLGYLSDKLNRPTAGLTTAGLLELLRQETQLEPALITQIEGLLTQIEANRFAPGGAGADGQSLIIEARQLVKSLDKNLK